MNKRKKILKIHNKLKKKRKCTFIKVNPIPLLLPSTFAFIHQHVVVLTKVQMIAEAL
jgi:hypothetical protein